MKHVRTIGKMKRPDLPKPAVAVKPLKAKKEPPVNTTMTL